MNDKTKLYLTNKFNILKELETEVKKEIKEIEELFVEEEIVLTEEDLLEVEMRTNIFVEKYFSKWWRRLWLKI